MKLAILLSLAAPAFAGDGKGCACKCLVKQEDGAYTTESAKGADREAAGEALKKKLGKRKCELSPECSGKGCKLDE